MNEIEILTNEDMGNGCHLIMARGPLAKWTMERAGDDDPAFPSRPLALVLGYERERKLYELHRRVWPAATEVGVSPHRGAKPITDENVIYFREVPSDQGKGGRPIKEYLYSRRQVLKLIMRSETLRASDLQDEYINVLLAVMREEAAPAVELQALRAQVSQLRGQHQELEQAVDSYFETRSEAARAQVLRSRRHEQIVEAELPTLSPALEERALRMVFGRPLEPLGPQGATDAELSLLISHILHCDRYIRKGLLRIEVDQGTLVLSYADAQGRVFTPQELLGQVSHLFHIPVRQGGKAAPLPPPPPLVARFRSCEICGTTGGAVHVCCPCKHAHHGHDGICGTSAEGQWFVEIMFGGRWKNRNKPNQKRAPTSFCRFCRSKGSRPKRPALSHKAPIRPDLVLRGGPELPSLPAPTLAPEPAPAAPAGKPRPVAKKRLPAMAVPAVLGPGASAVAEALSAASSAPPPLQSPWIARIHLAEEPASVPPPAPEAKTSTAAATCSSAQSMPARPVAKAPPSVPSKKRSPSPASPPAAAPDASPPAEACTPDPKLRADIISALRKFHTTIAVAEKAADHVLSQPENQGKEIGDLLLAAFRARGNVA